METLRNHFEMIDLNPLVIERKRQDKAPNFAGPEEFHATWYQITDNIKGLPGTTTYYGCFNDLADGLQTHVYAPAGLDIRGKWQLGGTLPGEPPQAVELGLNIPKQGLYLREDVDMKCNFMLTSFVKKTLKKSHAMLVARLLEKANIREAETSKDRIEAWRSETGSDGGSDAGSTYGSNRYSVAPSISGMSIGGPSNSAPSLLSHHGSTRESVYSQMVPPNQRGSPGYSPGQIDPTYQSYNHHSQNPHYEHNQHPHQHSHPHGYPQQHNPNLYPQPLNLANKPLPQPAELGQQTPVEAGPSELSAGHPTQFAPAELAG
jgi:hypothetical protein